MYKKNSDKLNFYISNNQNNYNSSPNKLQTLSNTPQTLSNTSQTLSNTPQTLSNISILKNNMQNFRKAFSYRNNNINNSSFKFEYSNIEELIEDLRINGFNDEIIPLKVKKPNIDRFGCKNILELDFKKNFKKLDNHFKLQLRDFFIDLFSSNQDDFLNIYKIAIQFTIGNLATHEIEYIQIPKNILSCKNLNNNNKKKILKQLKSFISKKEEEIKHAVALGASGLSKKHIDFLFDKWNNWKKNQPKFKYVLFRDALQTNITNNKFYNLNSRSDIYGRSTSINISSNKILARQIKEGKNKTIINKDKALFIIKIDENNMESFPFYLYLISAEYDQYEFLLPNIKFIAKNLEMVKVKLNNKYEACYAKLYLCESLKKHGSTYVKNNYNNKPINSGGNNKFTKNKIHIGPKGGKYILINNKKKYIK